MKKLVYQFRITLNVVEPPVWRVIQVPAEYTFWDLHVAIQDAIGWLDYHLHEFRSDKKHSSSNIRIGIPMSEEFDTPSEPLVGWDVELENFFHLPGDKMYYEYDFGDGWLHEVLLEGILLREKGVKYPGCIAGAQSAPPEDCGGPGGYYNLLEILADPYHEEYKETVAWLRHHAKNYLPFKPDSFCIESIKFSSPRRRWNSAFGNKRQG